ncbi:MAG: hypothetical protein ACE5GZ_12000, partial [Gammaproteobacteria bacterium]
EQERRVAGTYLCRGFKDDVQGSTSAVNAGCIRTAEQERRVAGMQLCRGSMDAKSDESLFVLVDTSSDQRVKFDLV